MRKRLIVLAALAVYMELVFHIYMGLDMEYAPLFLCAAAAWGFLASAAVSLLPERAGRIAGAILTLLMSVVYMAECICKQILQQYYQIVGGLDTAAGNHLGDYKKILTGPEKDDTINTTDARTSEEKNCC